MCGKVSNDSGPKPTDTLKGIGQGVPPNGPPAKAPTIETLRKDTYKAMRRDAWGR